MIWLGQMLAGPYHKENCGLCKMGVDIRPQFVLA